MSISQTQPLLEELVKAKIPKKTATNLIDFIEKNQSQELRQDIKIIKRDINWLKMSITGIFSLIIGLVGIVIYLHGDLKSDMNNLQLEINKRMDNMEAKIIEL